MMMPTSRPLTDGAARRSLATLLLLSLLVLLPTAVRAQEAESFKARYDKAVALYTSGQYERAIAEFQAVYELKQAPILLFNIAQAQRKAHQYKNAVDSYTRFLATNPKEELRVEADKFLTESRIGAEVEEQEAQAAAEKAAAEKAAAEKAAAAKAIADKVAAEKAAEQHKRRVGPTRPLNIAKWTVGGAGVLLTIVGAVLVGLDGRPACDLAPGQVLCPQELDTIAPGAALLGVGLGAIGASAVLFGLDYKQTRDGAQRATATVAMRF